MIKNERQYRITKAQAEKFEQALRQFIEDSKNQEQLHPLLHQAQIDSLQSQLDELRFQIEEYEALQSGKYQIIELDSFEDLPKALIQARIASGLSQKELAERLGLKEQQIQRYEATEYASASFERLKEVINALGIKVQENVILPRSQISLKALLKRLKEIGLDSDFVTKRLIPSSLLERLQGSTDEENTYGGVLKAASIVGRVFGWRPANLFDSTPLQFNMASIGEPRFKKAAKVNELHLAAYTVYAYFLAMLVLDATATLPTRPIPTTADEVRQEVLAAYGSLTFKSVLDYIWSLGIPVLPLSDPGAFQGACWRFKGRNIIVLKQQTMSEARWLFDLLHEFRHAGENPSQDEFQVIEATGIDKNHQQTREERIASRFAGDVLLNGRSEELAEKCVQAAKGSVERLKAVIPQIASRENVSTAALANYMAFRLSLQGIDWWGTAHNLQTLDAAHWQIARETLLEQVNLERVNEIDRNLLLTALS